jgi:hypothetical protein
MTLFPDFTSYDPDFEEHTHTNHKNDTVNLFSYAIRKIIAQSATLRTSLDPEETTDAQNQLLLSLSFLVSILASYMIDEPELTQEARKIIR